MRNIVKSTVLLSALSLSSVYAFEGIIKEDANLREAPSLNSKVIKVYLKGTNVEVDEKVYGKGSWYKLDNGFISSELIAKKSDNISIHITPSLLSQQTGEILLSHIDESDIQEVKLIKGEQYPWYRMPYGWVTFPHLKKGSGVVLEKIANDVIIEDSLGNKITSRKEVQKEEPKAKKIVKEEAKTVIKKEEIIEKKNMFVSFQVGASSLNAKKSDKTGTVTLLEDLGSSASNLALELGYEYKENIDLSINYKRVSNDLVSIDNLYVQSRYKFKQESFTPYLAANIGYSKLSWDKEPVNTADNKLDSTSYVIGANAGLLYPIYENTNLMLDYGLQYMGHKTAIKTSNTNTAEITHDILHSVNIGIRYDF